MENRPVDCDRDVSRSVSSWDFILSAAQENLFLIDLWPQNEFSSSSSLISSLHPHTSLLNDHFCLIPSAAAPWFFLITCKTQHDTSSVWNLIH